MRITVASVLLAITLASAHPHAGAGSHDAVVKARRSNSVEVAARHLNETLPAKDYIPHRIRFDGTHELEDVPEDLEPDEDFDDGDQSIFGGYDDTYEIEPSTYEFDPSDNSTTPIDERDLMEVYARSSSTKTAVAWTNDISEAQIKQFKGKVKGLYTWTTWWPTECKTYGIEFWPMLHDYNKRTTWAKTVKKGYGAHYMMGPNEVNLGSQAGLTTGKAAWLIRTYMAPLKNKGFALVGPSTANGASATAWYDKLKKEEPDVFAMIDKIPVHYYGLDYNKVISWLDTWYARYKKPIWLSEFGCYSFTGQGTCSQSQANTFVKKITAHCNSKSWCQMYALYGTFVTSDQISKSNAMFSSSSSLSSLGKMYLAS